MLTNWWNLIRMGGAKMLILHRSRGLLAQLVSALP